ncbi:MAG: hypothetical protein E4H41_04160 [Gemmatimonadales bacterium]|nr:MAG: hypothetical protein E4H41_04160 [Gemmatimonadales bacterium]
MPQIEKQGRRPRARHEGLKAWQSAQALTLEVYQVTKAWPVQERYGPIAQIRRAPSPFRRILPRARQSGSPVSFVDSWISHWDRSPRYTSISFWPKSLASSRRPIGANLRPSGITRAG